MKRWIAASICLFACSLPEDGLAPIGDASSPPDSSTEEVSVGGDASNEDAAMADAPTFPDVIDAPIVSAGDALQFGGGSFVDMGNAPIPTDFTLEAWIKPASSTGETYVVAKDMRNQGAGQFRFGLTSGKLFFVMSDSSGSTHGLYNNGYSLMTSQSIAMNVWTHVAVVKSGATFTLTTNGAVAATFTASASFGYGGPTVAFRVAARVDTNGSSPNGVFDGVIDEVRLWNLARSASQVASTMSTTVPPASAGLASYWRFDEGSGNTAFDQENAYTGTLVSSPTWVVSTAF
ncbi:MAG TPA: LamG domain-containing protein [Polyangiaceae bacterium]|nr:LamG domain-containing protein [Polyangiaceae bacterium]